MSMVWRFPRAAPVAAVALGALTVGLGLASVPLDVLTHQAGGGSVTDWLTTAAGVVPGAVVGTVLAARRPGNPIGWLLIAFFLLSVPFYGDYAILDYRLHHGTLPLGSVVVTLLSSWRMWLVLIAILLWVFPDGRLPAGRGRRVSVVLVTAGIALGLAVSAASAVALAGHAVRIDVDGNLVAPVTGALKVAQNILFVALFASMLGWLAVQVPGYRRSAGERREQLKWLYSGAVVFMVSVVVAVLTPDTSSAIDQASNDVITPIGFAVLPVCVGVAVLKYRLYEIDRIISRVISYAVVTAALAGVFAGVVLLATRVLPVKGPVAVAASTLVVAALFNPLRRRVQRVVDRRFNRARYNAEAVVAAFTTRLRQNVDLAAIEADLVGTVHQAFQPAHISVWTAGGDEPARLVSARGVKPLPVRLNGRSGP